MKEYVSKSKEQTQKIAANFAKNLKGGEVLCFYGDLGSGKTTFIQSLAKALGVKENVTSPTYVLMKRYRINRRGDPVGRPNKRASQRLAPTNPKTFFYHMDTYRLNSSQEALDLGLEEIWSDPTNIIAIEWADKISDILPGKKIDLCFACPDLSRVKSREHSRGKSIDENTRKITIFN